MNQFQSPPVISVEELGIRLDQDPDGLQLIDVREPQEVEIAYIEGFEVLSLSKFEQWSREIAQNFDPHRSLSSWNAIGTNVSLVTQQRFFQC